MDGCGPRHRTRAREAPRALRGLGDRTGVALSFLALALQLLLPLVVVCKTYRTLTPQPPSCCCCRAGHPGENTPRLQRSPHAPQTPATPCPYCTAISPFQHARYQASLVFFAGRSPIEAATPSWISAELPPADRTPCQPRAPPPFV
ncbi:MAG: hypothetical protein HY900_24395 [Deltaproteobacteria bacterium]|nr:hypothetical protein [Deltaproteobacteria bacterium]